NPHAGDFDPASAGDHALDARRREPGVDQLDQELGLEPVGQHDRLGAAVDGCRKQFEGSTALLLSGRHLGLGDVGSAYEIATSSVSPTARAVFYLSRPGSFDKMPKCNANSLAASTTSVSLKRRKPPALT